MFTLSVSVSGASRAVLVRVQSAFFDAAVCLLRAGAWDGNPRPHAHSIARKPVVAVGRSKARTRPRDPAHSSLTPPPFGHTFNVAHNAVGAADVAVHKPLGPLHESAR